MNGHDLRKHLESLPARMQRETAAVVSTLANELIAAQRAALRAKLAPPEETGALDSSIRREAGASELQWIVRAGGPSTTVGGYDRALAFEFGTQKQPARPFFYPPYRAMKKQMYYAISNAIVNVAKSEPGQGRITNFDQVGS